MVIERERERAVVSLLTESTKFEFTEKNIEREE